MQPKHHPAEAGNAPAGAPDPARRSFLKAAPLGAPAVVAGGAEAAPELPLRRPPNRR
ncbi:hypothetical protein G4G28_15285 [Massilia sp. Dwa41.01b]|uniref:hypothetical protein n=1 Tax=Massilia sp. Dwa41.01b TaxID=2709302 RepID=UPI001600DE9F|nr:hypothetical protein [Massilia sp. Dwa41.01b]QNA89490.1 hypothetical protein G4G28_15285 [Massilia sp. Dwa41.01b]